MPREEQRLAGLMLGTFVTCHLPPTLCLHPHTSSPVTLSTSYPTGFHPSASLTSSPPRHPGSCILYLSSAACPCLLPPYPWSAGPMAPERVDFNSAWGGCPLQGRLLPRGKGNRESSREEHPPICRRFQIAPTCSPRSCIFSWPGRWVQLCGLGYLSVSSEGR